MKNLVVAVGRLEQKVQNYLYQGYKELFSKYRAEEI